MAGSDRDYQDLLVELEVPQVTVASPGSGSFRFGLDLPELGGPGTVEVGLADSRPGDAVGLAPGFSLTDDGYVVIDGRVSEVALTQTGDGGVLLQIDDAAAEADLARALNGLALLEHALNLKSPTIYDVTTLPDGKEERKINQDDTLAAREKQKKIKDAFKAWIFTDPDRTERLVRIYNDTYNTIRLRTFDGAHLTYPGMNRNITLMPHQDDAIWRGVP